jgi:HlyD family secretion protein
MLRMTHTGLADQSGKSLDAQLIETVTSFVSDQTRNMVAAHRLADEKTADRRKAQVKIDRMTLRSPVDGVVQSLAVTVPGQVVTTGQELMRIVPSNAPVDIQPTPHEYGTIDIERRGLRRVARRHKIAARPDHTPRGICRRRPRREPDCRSAQQPQTQQKALL